MELKMISLWDYIQADRAKREAPLGTRRTACPYEAEQSIKTVDGHKLCKSPLQKPYDPEWYFTEWKVRDRLRWGR